MMAATAKTGFTMADVPLSLCLSGTPRNVPLLDGRVKPQGMDLTISSVPVSELFWRQLHFAEFDISEMSCSSLIIAISKGDKRFVALPIFPSRSFFHSWIAVRDGSGIEKPEDLKGRRVGVPEYQQTAALWARLALQQEWGVTAQDMDWYMERSQERSHGGATGFEAPKGVKFQYMPEGDDIVSMFRAGKIDAAFPTFRAGNRPGIRNLFRDPVAEGGRYYKKTGFYPMNHCIIIKREVAEKYPWAPINIYNAFQKAKELVQQETKTLASVYFELDLAPHDRIKALDVDPFPYGLAPNRAILEAMTKTSYEQGLTSRVMDLKEIFHPALMEDHA